MHKEGFENLLWDSISLLQELPRERARRRKVRAPLQRLREKYPENKIDLLIDAPPGSPRLDYDLLIEHPTGGTVALSWRADAKSPWVVDYADHHNANFLVTVNGEPITVQQALLFLQADQFQKSGLMQQIVDEQLIEAAIQANPVTVSTAEIQKATDDFRATNGLLKAADTQQWLKETGISVDEFLSQMEWIAERRKFLKAIAVDRIEAYFESHRADFRRVQVFSIDVKDEASAMELRQAAQGLGFAQAVLDQPPVDANKILGATLRWRFAFELPAEVKDVQESSVVGPVSHNGGYWIAQILRADPARLDNRSRDCIHGRLVDEWLTKAREKAAVRWHWL